MSNCIDKEFRYKSPWLESRKNEPPSRILLTAGEKVSLFAVLRNLHQVILSTAGELGLKSNFDALDTATMGVTNSATICCPEEYESGEGEYCD